MTTEQMALVKKLIQKHEIEATDAEWTLIFMGVGYGLSEQQIDSYLVAVMFCRSFRHHIQQKHRIAAPGMMGWF